MNFHPPLTAFPIALFIVSLILEILGNIRKNELLISCARVNMLAAVVFMFGAFFSGYKAAELASGTFKVPADAIKNHHSIGRILLFTSIPGAVLAIVSRTAKEHRAVFKSVYYLFLLSCVALAVYCGLLGGRLVFAYGAGVNV